MQATLGRLLPFLGAMKSEKGEEVWRCFFMIIIEPHSEIIFPDHDGCGEK